MSFSEGFTQGFNMVDGALQKRNANALEQQKQVRDEAHYNDALTRQGTQDAQALKWHDDAAGLAATATTYAHGRDTADDTFRNTTQKNTEKHNDRMEGLQSQSNEISRINSNNQAAHYKLLGKASQAKLAEDQYDLRIKKNAQEKADALPIFQGMIDPKTNLPTFSTDPKVLDIQMNAMSTMTNLPVKDMYTNNTKFDADINNIKTGMADMPHWEKNKDSIMKSLNFTMGKDIAAGKIGQSYDGTDPAFKGAVINGISIVNMLPSPGGDGLIADVRTEYKMPNGSYKSDHGPMTDLRTSNPDTDPNIRVIPHAAIVGKIDAIDQLTRAIASDPAHMRTINSVLNSHKGKAEDNYEAKVAPDERGASQVWAVSKKDGHGIHVNAPDKQQGSIKPAPQNALDYLAKHPEAKDQFIEQFGYSPN